jgi:hypothetical protein
VVSPALLLLPDGTMTLCSGRGPPTRTAAAVYAARKLPQNTVAYCGHCCLIQHANVLTISSVQGGSPESGFGICFVDT